VFGTVSMGYGDLFVAALLGAVLAHQWRRQWQAAVLTLVIAGCFDLLFFFINELPATVPVALALVVTEGWQWRQQRRVSVARRRPSMRADAIPRQAR
jgi:CHASE2 domain-containing sensor protein